MKRIQAYSILFCFLLNLQALAQKSVFKTWSVQEGLPQSIVYDIEEDENGYLWIATYGGGVAKFDGHKFVVFDDESGLSGMKVKDLEFDHEGKLWIGTEDQGLFYKTDEGFNNLGYSQPVKWIKINNEKLFVFSNNSVSEIKEDGFEIVKKFSARITKCEADSNYVAFQLETGETYLLNDLECRQIGIDDPALIFLGFKENLLVFYGSNELLYYDYRSDEVSKQTIDLRHHKINGYAYFEEQDWYMVNGRGVGQFNNGKLSVLNDKNGLRSKILTCFFKDSRGNLWVGTEGGGLSKYVHSSYTLFDQEAGLGPARVMGLDMDKYGNLWIGSLGDGVYRMKGNSTIKMKQFKSDLVLSIATTDDGDVLAGTIDDGVWLFKQGNWRKLIKSKTRITKMLVVDEKLWVAHGSQSVVCYNVNSGNPIAVSGSAPKNVFDIIYDSATEITWFATNGHGLWVEKGNHYERAQHVLIPTNLLSITMFNGIVWLGSDGKGVVSYDIKTDSCTVYTKSDGLLSNYIYQLEFDKRGNLWIGGQKGIEKANVNDQNKIIKIMSAAAQEQYLTAEVNLNASLSDGEGGMWIGNVYGLVYYDYKQQATRQIQPSPIIEKVEIFNEKVSLTQSSGFDYTLNQFTFHFTGLGFEDPENVIYRYKLEPVEEDWMVPTREDMIIYGNLQPGTYRFILQSKYKNSGWSGSESVYEFEIVPPFWKTTWFYLTAAGVLLFVFFMFVKWREIRSVVRQKRLEQEIEARTAELRNNNEELEKAKNQALEAKRTEEQFLANVSHEMRTPMNAILGITNLLLDSELDESQTSNLKNVKFSADNLLTLVNDVLDITKLKSGEFILNHGEFNLHEMLAGLEQTFLIRTEKKGIRFEVIIDKSAPRVVISDKVRIYQILQNLLDNAIKFTHQGEVKLTVYLDELEGERLVFKVKDTGVGIKKEDLQKVFERFKQVDKNEANPGIGLGLAITSNIIDKMDGDVTVDSDVDMGTTFVVKIPVKVADVSLEQTKIVYHPLDIRILIAEDNELNREVIEGFLKKFEVTYFEFAFNGIEVLKKIDQTEFDLILMDINMPEMDGIEATKIIRKNPNKEIATLPIIALSAYYSEKHKHRFRGEGLDDFLPKPFEPEILYKVLASHCKDVSESKIEIKDETAPAMSFKIIDLKMLNQLGNEKVARKIIELFVNSFPHDVTKLEIAFKDANYEETRKILHNMKSAVKYFSISEADAILERMSNFARSEVNDAYENDLHALVDLGSAAIVELNRYLAK